MGELVQRLDERPLAEAVRRRVLDPAGVARDGFSLGEPDLLPQPPQAVHTRDERGAPPATEVEF